MLHESCHLSQFGIQALRVKPGTSREPTEKKLPEKITRMQKGRAVCNYGSSLNQDCFYAPCGLPGPTALCDLPPTSSMHCSRTSSASSASLRVTTSGGAIRIEFGP